ncbi:hypothetical protein AB4Y43_01025 [Paraburkholderia sp. BR10872]|uniref:hypothetical protein n=1 Tax=Paraburkholderia sp. BR10872 TaxID=3236989 RepID=UPI0034D31ADD
MGRDIEAMKALNEAHLQEPQVGDMWEEMCNWVCVVLDVTPDTVTICRKKKAESSQWWSWDLAEAEELTRAEFRAWLSYGCIPGTWAYVHARRGKGDAEYWRDKFAKPERAYEFEVD